MDKHKHVHVTQEYGGGFNVIAATIIIILVAVGLLYFAGAVPRNIADQQKGSISVQEPSPSQGVIKPPNTGDAGGEPR